MQVNIHNTTNNQFTKYSNTSVTIKDEEYQVNIIVTNDKIEIFNVVNIKELVFDDLKAIVEQKPDLVIFGTGDRIVFPDPQILQKLNRLGIGSEVMPIQALCRTFNFLVSEGRKVVCILFF